MSRRPGPSAGLAFRCDESLGLVTGYHSLMRVVWVLLTAVAVLFGCASSTGVVPMNDDTFRIYKRGNTGFVGSEAIEADLMRQANKFCADRGESLKVTNVLLGGPPYFRGNFPKAEVQFKCVNARDLRSADFHGRR